MYYTRTKLGKINPENFLRNAKQEYYNMENKILDFQFGPVCANQTRPNYSVGSEQDEAQIQECLCCHKIQAVKSFHLKFKAGLS